MNMCSCSFVHESCREQQTLTFDICEPWYGDKGGPFTRTFSPAFLSGMRGKSEEYVTY